MRDMICTAINNIPQFLFT